MNATMIDGFETKLYSEANQRQYFSILNRFCLQKRATSRHKVSNKIIIPQHIRLTCQILKYFQIQLIQYHALSSAQNTGNCFV